MLIILKTVFKTNSHHTFTEFYWGAAFFSQAGAGNKSEIYWLIDTSYKFGEDLGNYF